MFFEYSKANISLKELNVSATDNVLAMGPRMMGTGSLFDVVGLGKMRSDRWRLFIPPNIYPGKNGRTSDLPSDPPTREPD